MVHLKILTNTPTPYRIPFFNALQQALAKQHGSLSVTYCAFREPHRQWHIDLENQHYSWKILPGIHPSIRGFYPHINPSVLYHLYQEAPDFLLVAGAWNTPTMMIANWLSWKRKAKTLFWSEGHAHAVRYKGGAIAKLRRHSLQRYDGFAVPNIRSKDYVQSEVGKDKPVLILPNTVHEETYTAVNQIPKSEARQKLDIETNKTVFIFIGRLEDRKGVLELLHGLEIARKHSPQQIELLIIGTGSLSKQLQKNIDKKKLPAKLLGHLEGEHMCTALAASDAFILPTKLDPNPLTPIEAAFAGLPLLLSRQAGNVQDLITSEKSGFIIEEISGPSIAKAMTRFSQCTASAQQEMGAYVKDTAMKNFRRGQVAEEFTTQLLNTPFAT